MPTLKKRVQEALAWLEAHGTPNWRDDMARFGITATKAFGVSMVDLKRLAKLLGRDHALAVALWDTGWYDARLLASLIDEPELVTRAQMDQWCRDFESWADCDTACFNLFDKTPHAWAKVEAWATRREEFEKRAAFALLASVALHDKKAADAPFLKSLSLVEAAAVDDRNFVKKAVSWALRAIGGRGAAPHAAATTLARRLASSPNAAARWVGKDVLRDISRPLVARRVAARDASAKAASKSDARPARPPRRGASAP